MCFRRFDDTGQVAQVVEGRVVRWAERGDLLTAEGARPDALLLVARGAVEVTVPCHGAAQRVRLAGPGRFVGHLGALDEGPSPVAARARERAVLIEFPRECVNTLLDCQTSAPRRFTAAVYEDVARAVQQAERVMARTLATGRADARRPVAPAAGSAIDQPGPSSWAGTRQREPGFCIVRERP